MVLAALAVSGALFGVGRATWINATAHGLAGSATEVAVTGANAAPVVPALALVGAAAACTFAIGRRGLALGSAAVLALAGAAAAVASIVAAIDPAGAASAAVSDTTGVLGGSVQATLTPYAYAAVAACALVDLVGVWGMLVAWKLPRQSPPSQYSRHSTHAGEEFDDAAAWDSLSTGKDPTA